MKKMIKRLAGLLLLIGAIAVVNKVLTYILLDDAADEVRYSMQEMYKQENVETLFLGSSHAFCGYYPAEIEAITGENVYVAGTPVQKIDGSYYLLKEMLKKNKIKKVYLDMYYRQYRDVPEKRFDDQMAYIYCITDYMKPGWNRVEFILNASGSDRYIDGLLPASRYGNHLLDLQRFEKVVKSKRSEEYANPSSMAHFYKGVNISPDTLGEPKLIDRIGQYELARIDETAIMSEYSLKMLDKTVDLCKKEGIELVLTSTPFTNYHLAAMENYDVFYKWVKEYAEKNGIEYYDFNLCRLDTLNLPENYFLDSHHLSGKGAVEYSKVFADIMTNYEKDEREQFFYDSVEEKLSELPEQTFGIILEEVESGSGKYEVHVVANYPVEAEYKIDRVDGNGNLLETVQDFGEEHIIFLSEDAINAYHITAREKSTGETLEEESIHINSN